MTLGVKRIITETAQPAKGLWNNATLTCTCTCSAFVHKCTVSKSCSHHPESYICKVWMNQFINCALSNI